MMNRSIKKVLTVWGVALGLLIGAQAGNEKFDLLVDGNLPADDPQNNQFKTLQAAYAAAPVGAEEHPTIIGIRPNVYLLQGGALAPGLKITKNYITLLGLTDDRRLVVLADNRGLQQGADNNGFLLDVNATGFTCRNLTILNYCNVDYEYPGDPSKNLKKRSDVITQAVALQATGDKHIYENVAILSRLDTLFLSPKRAYFKNVHIEGTDDWLGGGDIAYWEDCTLEFPTGNGVCLAMNDVFRRCTFKSENGLQFYKVGFNSHLRPSALIDCTIALTAPDAKAAWMREAAPQHPVRYSLYSNLKDAAGAPFLICDSTIGSPAFNHSVELNEEQLRAFNPWNLLRAAPGEMPDDWDPANTQKTYSGQGALPFRIELTKGHSFKLRTGEGCVTLGAQVTPIYANDATISWTTDSDLIRLNQTTGSLVNVIGNNQTEQAEWVAVHAITANGLRATAWIYVEPEYLAAPSIVSGPTLSPPIDGKLELNYALDLAGRPDQSLITWFVCDDANGKSERAVAVSRRAAPLTSLKLTGGYVGKYIKATLQPKHQRCEPGAPVSVISKTPVSADAISTTTESPDFRHFVITPNNTFHSGMWTVSDNWKIEQGDGLENGCGIHSKGPASLFYQNDTPINDMTLDLWFRPDKTAGQVFSVPGSPEDEGENNLHADIYFKYDPRTGNGYSLRFWRTKQSGKAVMFQFYKIENGKGRPMNDQQVLSGVFKRDTHLTLKVTDEVVHVWIENTKDDNALSLESKIGANEYGGAGMSWSRGSSAICSRFIISYP